MMLSLLNKTMVNNVFKHLETRLGNWDSSDFCSATNQCKHNGRDDCKSFEPLFWRIQHFEILPGIWNMFRRLEHVAAAGNEFGENNSFLEKESLTQNSKPLNNHTDKIPGDRFFVDPSK